MMKKLAFLICLLTASVSVFAVDSTRPNLNAVVTPAGTDLYGVRQSGDTRDKKLTRAIHENYGWKVRSAAEIAASITPSDYSYPPGMVQRYGAVGDGTADDYQAIVDSIAQNAQGGAAVYLPAGTYQVELTILLQSVSNIQIYGDGAGVTTIRAKVFPASFPLPITGSQGVITIGNQSEVAGQAPSYVTIHNLTIDGQGAAQPNEDAFGEFMGLAIRAGSYIWLYDMEIKDGPKDTIYVADTTNFGSATLIHHIWFDNIHFGAASLRRTLSLVSGTDMVFSNIIVNGGNGSSVGLESNTGNTAIERVLFSNILVDGGNRCIAMTADDTQAKSVDIAFQNMVCSGSVNTDSAIQLSVGDRISFDNLTILAAAGRGIDTGTGSELKNLTLSNVLITGPASTGVRLRSTKHATLDNVRVFGALNSGVGIQITDSGANFSSDIKLTNCVTNDGTSYGVWVQDAATRVQIIGHESVNNDAAGLFLNPDITDAEYQVIGGYFGDNATDGISVAPPASFVGSILLDGVRATDTAASDSQEDGIDLSDTDVDYVRLVNSDLRGNVTNSVNGSVGGNGVSANNIL